jgi:hypothetical protein
MIPAERCSLKAAELEIARGRFAAWDDDDRLVASAPTYDELERLVLALDPPRRVSVHRVPLADEPLRVGLG